jgi:DNA-binding FadR family transcriptional regulator
MVQASGAMRDDVPPRPAGAQRSGANLQSRRRPFRGVKTSTLVASRIIRDVGDQGLVEGDHLPTEAVLIERFGVGRASLREALRFLEIQGLITIRPGPNGGPVVGPLDPGDLGRMLSLYFYRRGATFRELVQSRLLLEPMMAGEAARSQDPVMLARLREALDIEEHNPVETDGYLAGANLFHLTVSEMGGNRVLELVAASLKTLFTDRVSGSLVPVDDRPRIRREHAAIAEAILGGDAQAAERLMHEHMTEYVRFVEVTQPALLDEVIAWE